MRYTGRVVLLLAMLMVAAGCFAQSQSDPDVPVLKRRPPATSPETPPDDTQTPASPTPSAPQPESPPPAQQPQPQAPAPAPPADEPASSASAPHSHDHHAEMMRRGGQVMGFDQQTTEHHFVMTRSGGLVRVTVKNPEDTDVAGRISAHLRTVASQFARGDFSSPEETHGQAPPGVGVMRELRSRITYTAHAIQDGAELIISSSDPKAINAIHQFLRFQIEDHQTGDPVSMR